MALVDDFNSGIQSRSEGNCQKATMEVGGWWARRTLPGLGEAANTRVFYREHGVPLRTRFLLEQKGEDMLGEEEDNREDLFSMICPESGQCSGKILAGREEKMDRTGGMQSLMELQCGRWGVTLGFGVFEVILINRDKMISVDRREELGVRF